MSENENMAVVPLDGGADDLVQIAANAEKRIDAVLKIKRVALKVTNAMDWVDQRDKPYLMASGSEKIAGLFNISWRLLSPEPALELEPDGNYTYTYSGEFSMGSRSVHCEGSRSSRDKFFTQYDYDGKEKKEKLVGDRDNKRDVKMAAYTNLLGNGITRILGIRNLTYADLLEFAGIKKEQLQKVVYNDHGKANVKPAQSTDDQQADKAPEGGEGETFKDKLFKELNGDVKELKRLTTFKDKDGVTVNGKGKWEWVSEAGAKAAYGRLKDEQKAAGPMFGDKEQREPGQDG